MLLVTFLQLFIYSFLLIIWAGTMYTFWLTLFYPPFVPTLNKKVLAYLSDYLDTNPKITHFCEPGCGLAGVAIYIAKKFPNIEVIAIEYNYFIYFLAKIWIKITGSKVHIFHGDILKFDFKSKLTPNQSLVYCYLLPSLMDEAFQLGKFQNTEVVTLDFKISEAKCFKECGVETNGFQKKIYQYDFRDALVL